MFIFNVYIAQCAHYRLQQVTPTQTLACGARHN